MTEKIRQRLKPVRKRRQRLFLLGSASVGLLAGSCLAVPLAIARLLGASVPAEAALVVSAVGLTAGLLVGLLCRQSWNAAAIAVDSHYELKDRAETALAFLNNPDATILHQLQISDTIDRLEGIEPGHVAPWRSPKTLPYAVAALAVALTLALLPAGTGTARAEQPAPLAEILQQAERLEETVIEDLEEMAKEEQDPQLEQLVEELKELLEEMKEPGVDPRDALAKLSEMQAAVAAAMAEYNLEAVDASLQELAEAIAAAPAMKSVSKSLEEGEYDKAAKDLEEMDPKDISRKEAQTVAEMLKKLAEKMKKSKLGELSDATSKMAQGMKSDDESECKDGACKLAGECRKQAVRKKVGQCLGAQLNKLAECKSACSAASKNGGNNISKSDDPTNNWGRGASQQPLGDKTTSLDGTRQREDISGTHGDGPSEKEVTHSQEGREEASRAYRAQYEKYRKMSEAVLDSEPLPLGHRQTIRRYFESIHPENGDMDMITTPEATGGTE